MRRWMAVLVLALAGLGALLLCLPSLGKRPDDAPAPKATSRAEPDESPMLIGSGAAGGDDAGQTSSPGTNPWQDVTPEREADDLVLHGRVLDETDAPVAGCSVEHGFRTWAGAPLGLIFGYRGEAHDTDAEEAHDTDAAGRFTLRVRTLEKLEVWARGSEDHCESTRVRVSEVPGEIVLRVAFHPQIEGIVLSTAGQPVAALPVNAVWTDADQQRHRVSEETDPGGRFELTIPPGAGRADVLIGLRERKDRKRFGGELGRVFRNVPLDAPWMRVVLQVPVGLSGTVRRADGTPCRGGSVEALRLSDGPDQIRVRFEIDRQTGRFRMTGLRPGPWSIQAHPSEVDAAVSKTRVIDAPQAEVVLEVPDALPIAGQLQGEDVKGFTVAWFGERNAHRKILGTVQTDATGQFVIPRLTAGSHDFYVWRDQDDRYARVVGLHPSAQVHEVVLRRGLRIEGKLAGKRPHEDSRVLARSGDLEVSCRIREDGSFSVCGLAPGPWALSYTWIFEGGGLRMELEMGSPASFSAGATKVVLGGF